MIDVGSGCLELLEYNIYYQLISRKIANFTLKTDAFHLDSFQPDNFSLFPEGLNQLIGFILFLDGSTKCVRVHFKMR